MAANQFGNIDTATSGDNTLVAAVTGKRIRLIKLFMVSQGTVSVHFKSGSNSLMGGTRTFDLTAGTGFVIPGGDDLGWCETAPGEALVLNLSVAIGVAGAFSYMVT